VLGGRVTWTVTDGDGSSASEQRKPPPRIWYKPLPARNRNKVRQCKHVNRNAAFAPWKSRRVSGGMASLRNESRAPTLHAVGPRVQACKDAGTLHLAELELGPLSVVVVGTRPEQADRCDRPGLVFSHWVQLAACRGAWVGAV